MSARWAVGYFLAISVFLCLRQSGFAEGIHRVPDSLQRHFSKATFFDINRGYLMSNEALIGTDDGGISWRVVMDVADQTDMSPPIPHFLDTERFWVKTSQVSLGEPDEHLLFQTTDGGRTFESYPADFAPTGRGRPDVCTWLHFRTATEAWASCRHSLQKSTDGGRTWSVVRALGDGLDLEHLWMFSEVEGLARVRNPGGAARTEDGGVTWKQMSSDVVGELRCADDDFCLAWTRRKGPVFASRDRGRTWQDIGLPLQADERDLLWDVQPVRDQLVVAVGEDLGFTATELNRIEAWDTGIEKEPPRGFVLKWNGSNWNRIDHADPDGFNGVFFVDAEHGWLFAHGRVKAEPNRVFKTSDGGQTLQFVPDYFRQLAAATATAQAEAAAQGTPPPGGR